MIGYVSRIAVEKNVGYLVEALERVRADRGARFLFVGDGPARVEIEGTGWARITLLTT